MHKLACLLVLLALLTGCSLFDKKPAAPAAKINGPNAVAPGNPVKLTCEGSVGTTYWSVVPIEAANNFFKLDDGIMFVSSTPGRYTFLLVAVSGGQADLALHEVYNGGNPPNPNPPNPNPPNPYPPTPPGPNPPNPYPPTPDPPNPNPTPADWLTSLASNVKMLAEQYVPATHRADSARALSASMKNVITQAESGPLASQDMPSIRAAMREANREALGEKGWDKDWEKFNDELRKGLETYAGQGKLETKQDFIAAWKAIVNGLEQVEGVRTPYEPSIAW